MRVALWAAALLVAATGQVYAHETRAVEPYACRPTLEQWARKADWIGDAHVIAEAFIVGTVQWSSGTQERVMVGPVPTKGYCVVAAKYVGSAQEQAAR